MIREELRKKVGQMMMCGFPSLTADDQARALVNDLYVGNFVLFTRNCASGRQVAELNRELADLTFDKLGVSPFITLDQEGGNVTRLTEGAALMPGAAAVSAATRELTEEYLQDVYQLGVNDGRILRACGITMSLAPDMDVNIEPANPIIGVRSYGDDPERVAKVASAMVLGMKAGGVGGTIKHFPGHGNVKSDSHLGVPVNDTPFETLLETEFKPFELAIKSGAEAIMSAHVCYTQVDPETPGTLSHKIHTELLRERYGFEGIDMTDCLEMDAIRKTYPNGEGAVRAIEAGVDMILISHTYAAAAEAANAVYAALESGRLTEARIDESYNRIMRLKEKMGLLTKQTIDPDRAMAETNDPEKLAHCRKMSKRAITLLRGEVKTAVNEKLLVVAPAQMASTGAEDFMPLSLAETMAEECGCMGVELPWGGEDSDAIEACMEKVSALIDAGQKQVLLGLYNLRFRPAHKRMLEMLEARGDISLTVALMGAPYDLPMIGGGEAVLTTYDYTRLSVSQLIEALKEGKFEGVNPFPKM